MEHLLFVISASVCGYVQRRRGRETKVAPHENPRLSSQGRLLSHVMLSVHVSVEEARRHVLQSEPTPFALVLTGMWDFSLHASVSAAFKARDAPGKPTGRIWCPSNWQVRVPGEGDTMSDFPLYTNIKYVLPTEPTEVPKSNPTGYYSSSFVVPQWWEGRRIIINFGGVDSCMYLYVNGHYVGYSSDSRLPAEFDLTALVHMAKLNTIEVVVPRYSMGSYLEDQDMWNLSGIFREVVLFALPNPVHLIDFDWKCSPAGYSPDYDTFRSADISVFAKLEWSSSYLRQLTNGSSRLDSNCPHYSQLIMDWEVDVSLFSEGVLISSRRTSTAQEFIFDNPEMQPTVQVLETHVPVPRTIGDDPTVGVDVCMSLNLANAKAWSPESPHLYTLVLSLRNVRTREVVQSESCRVGIRSVVIKDGLLCVNRKNVLIRGVNWHEHDPVTGHSIAFDLIEADIKLMKRNNFNAIRTSHYPQTHWTYELCSLYGLFVVDEANIETHGMTPYTGRLADDPDWHQMHMDRATRMYLRDKIHPSIICWSLGNEAGYGPVHDAMAAWLKATDPLRPIMYEPASYGHTATSDDGGSLVQPYHEGNATDIICPMYARVEDCLELIAQCKTKPLILCEYAHMMGNSGGNFASYWKAFHKHTRLQGGFIWDWVDQGLSVSDPTRPSTWCYGGDHCEGDRSHDAQFCINGLVWPDRGLGSDLSDARHTQGYVPRREMSNPYGSYGLCTKASLGGRSATAATNREPFAMVEEVEQIPIRKCKSHLETPRKSRDEDTPTTSFHEGIDVNKAMSKPQLLEAKVCMQYFDCFFVDVDCWPAKKASSTVVFDHQKGQSQFESSKVQKKTYTHKTDEWEILVRIEFEIATEARLPYEFHCYLLYDGLVVGQEMLVDVDNFDDERESGGETTFSINVHSNGTSDSIVPPLHKEMQPETDGLHFLGYRWPESALLSSVPNFSFPDTHADLTPAKVTTSSLFKAGFGNGDTGLWSTVIVGRLRDHTAWAPKAFPLGLRQLAIPSSNESLRTGLMKCLETITVYEEKKKSERGSLKAQCTVTTTWNLECNVLMQATRGENCVTSAIVSTKTGMLQSLIVDGRETLDSTDGSPMVVQLHRARTDNDIGYIARWKACGMDRRLEYVASLEYDANVRQSLPAGTSVTDGQWTFECTSVRSYEVDDMQEGRTGRICSGRCTETSWLLEPSSYSPALMSIITRVQAFASTGTKTEVLLGLSVEEEAFAYSLAKMLSLRRTTEAGSSGLDVTLSKPEPFFINSTTKSALALVGSPVGSPIQRSDTVKMGMKPSVSVTAKYVLSSDGRLSLSALIDTSAVPIPLPRVGICMTLQGDLDAVVWRGAGPHENYSDRDVSTVDAVHATSVDRMHTPYIVPSESGTRGRVKWVSLSNSAGTRLSVEFNENSHFSAQKYSTEALSMATHSSYLDQPREGSPTFLNLDGFMMGVGGDDSWSACVHEEHLMKPGSHRVAFTLS